ncbi:MAG: hypothetical protein QW745_06970 [Thermoplasmata archaeon]
MNEVKEQNNETKNEDTWKLMFDQIQKLQEQQKEMMEKIKQESSQKIQEIDQKISIKKNEILKLQAELNELEIEKSKILSLLGMKNSNSNNIRNSSRIKYEYHGMVFTSATSLIQSLPSGNLVLQEYPHASWVQLINRIFLGQIPPRIQNYVDFLNEIKNVKIIQ